MLLKTIILLNIRYSLKNVLYYTYYKYVLLPDFRQFSIVSEKGKTSHEFLLLVRM